MQITVEPATIYGIKLGPESAERTFEVLYLDERVRIVQFLPSDLAQSSDPVLFVLRRLSAVHSTIQVFKHMQASVHRSCSSWGLKLYSTYAQHGILLAHTAAYFQPTQQHQALC